MLVVVAGPGPGLVRRAERAVGKGHWLLLLLESGEEQDQDRSENRRMCVKLLLGASSAVPEVAPPAGVRPSSWLAA